MVIMSGVLWYYASNSKLVKPNQGTTVMKLSHYAMGINKQELAASGSG